ncbi:MAG: O-antigen ligase family protein [Planctomycetota bacterium]
MTVADPVALTAPASAAATSRRSSGWPAWLLLAPLVLAPLPLGAVEALPRSVLTAVACGIGVLHVLRASSWQRLAPPGAIPFAILAVVAFAQILPNPLGGITETAASVRAEYDATSWSLVPSKTASRARELLALLALFGAGAALLGKRSQARRVLWGLVLLAAGLAGYGILVRAGAAPPVVPELQREVVSATFFNRNHFAALLEMALLAGLGLWAAGAPGQSRRVEDVSRQRAVRLLLLACLGLCAVALLLTHSRGGVVATGAGVLAWLALDRRRRGASLGPVLVALPLLPLALWLAAPQTLQARFEGVGAEWVRAGTRPDIWLGGLRLWAAFPFTGIGFGCYRDLSPLTQPAAIGGRVEHAHCDPLQMLVEGGAIAALLAAAAAVLWCRYVWRRATACRDGTRAELATGPAAAVAAITVHGLVEFNLQIPALAMWFAVLAGMATGLLRSRRRAAEPAVPLWLRLGLAAVLALSAAGALAEASSAWLWDREQARTELEATAADRARALHGLAGTIDLGVGTTSLDEDPDAALTRAERSLALNPFEPKAHRLRGRALLRRDDPNAGAAFDRAMAWTNPHDRRAHRWSVAREFLSAQRLDEGLTRTRALLADHPELADDVLDELYEQLPAYELVRPAVPDQPEVHAAFLALLLRVGEFGGREAELAAAAGREPRDGAITLTEHVTLLGARAELAPSTRRVAVAVELDVDASRRSGDAADPAPLVFRCEGPEAAVYRSFDIVPGMQHYGCDLDPTFPPARYALTLQVLPGAARLPLLLVDVPDTPLTLRFDASVAAADHLYWGTRPVARRKRPPHGLPLRPGDRLWRRVARPATEAASPATLVVVCDRDAQLIARLDGAPLEVTGLPRATTQRFAVPGGTGDAHLLELTATGDDDAVVERLLLVPRTP